MQEYYYVYYILITFLFGLVRCLKKIFFYCLGVNDIFNFDSVGTVISQSGYQFFLISLGNLVFSQASMLIKNVERKDKVSYLPF